MLILGIETSCDDTAAAVLDGSVVRSSVVSSQHEVHGPYGGVVPELASRHHLQNVLPVVHSALERASAALSDLRGIAVTAGPGLVGSLLVGVSTAKGIALARGLPLIGVNHLEGHLLAGFLEHSIDFPFLALLVSGGHTSLVYAEDFARYRLIGRTVDDAAGEALDKGAKMLGLGFPGGPEIDRLSRSGDPAAIRFPRAVVRSSRFDFSFSGLKTALRQHLESGRGGAPADIAASFQEAVVDVLVTATMRAVGELGAGRVVVSGGVSANTRLRAAMAAAGERHGFEVFVPSRHFCTDNAAMIAYAGGERLRRGERSGLDLEARASLPL